MIGRGWVGASQDEPCGEHKTARSALGRYPDVTKRTRISAVLARHTEDDGMYDSMKMRRIILVKRHACTSRVKEGRASPQTNFGRTNERRNH